MDEKMGVIRKLCYVGILYAMLTVALWDPKSFPYKPLPDVWGYDYVIVGGGTSGSVLANRLSEDPNVTVLVIEAGDHDNDWSMNVPSSFTEVQFRKGIDWMYRTIPQSNACEAILKQISLWPMGLTMGGTSSTNNMMYVRGNKADYDQWAKNGATGWSYDEVLPYFKKSESFEGTGVDFDYHGMDGPLSVNKPGFMTPLADAFLEGTRELGYNTVDYNGEHQLGFSPVQNTINYRGSRVSTSNSYLHPVRRRPNLTVLKKHMVRSLKFENNTVVGVYYTPSEMYVYGGEQLLRVNREVIVSAGPVNTPVVLMISGIGIASHLEQVPVTQIQELPVGRNLQDAIMVPIPIIVDGDVVGDTITDELLQSPLSTIQYSLTGGGPLGSTGLEVVGFLNSGFEIPDSGPDLQFLLYNRPMGPDLMRLLGITASGAIHLWGYELTGDEIKPGYILFVVLLHPRSRGFLQLDTVRSPFQMPLINPGYLSDKRDREILIKGIRTAQKQLNTTAFTKYKGRMPTEKSSSPFEYDSDDFWSWYVSRASLAGYSPCGTCKMGSEDDPTAVVDPQLRVKGVNGVRVADASVMPQAISGNIYASSVMIAEKAADLIKSSWNKKAS